MGYHFLEILFHAGCMIEIVRDGIKNLADYIGRKLKSDVIPEIQYGIYLIIQAAINALEKVADKIYY